MPNSLSKTCLQHLSQLNPQENIDLADQMQEQIVKLQQALELELTLRRISEMIQTSSDEAHVLRSIVQQLALELEADCCAALFSNTEQLFPSNTPFSNSNTLNTVFGCHPGRILPDDLPEHRVERDQPFQGDKYFQAYFNACTSQEKFTLFACPIIDGDETLGTLWVIREMSRLLSDPEIYLVQQAVKQCAITIHQLRLYQAAQKQIEELQHLNEVKDDFLNRVTHDLRSPLSNMRLAIYMLEQQLMSDKLRCGHVSQQTSACSKTLTHLKILQTECEREIALVNDLLDLQRLESENQPLSLDAIDLKDWLTNLIQPFEERIQQRQLTLKLHIAPNLPTLISDSANLHRVLSELLHNACKYTPPQETISLSAVLNSDQVEIKVSNSGVEIPAEELPKIFDKFYRIPGSDRWKQGGTGLGLALVQQLVHHLGSSIQVESGSSETCFAIKLPLNPVV